MKYADIVSFCVFFFRLIKDCITTAVDYYIKTSVNIFFKNNNEADYLEKYWEGQFYKVVFFPGLYTIFHANYPLLISTNR